MRLISRTHPLMAAATVALLLSACDAGALLGPCTDPASEGGECAAPPRPSGYLTEAQFVEHFLDLASSGKSGRIGRWVEPVTVEVQGGSEADRVSARDAAARLAAASGHPVMVVHAGGSLVVRIIPRNEFRQHISGATAAHAGICAPLYDSSRTIYGGTVLIASDLPVHDRGRLILHELAHALGLTGHSTRYAESVLYPTVTRRTRLLEQDRFALRTLYRPDVRPGMTLAQVRGLLESAP
jgi:hypothetical protein